MQAVYLAGKKRRADGQDTVTGLDGDKEDIQPDPDGKGTVVVVEVVFVGHALSIVTGYGRFKAFRTGRRMRRPYPGSPTHVWGNPWSNLGPPSLPGASRTHLEGTRRGDARVAPFSTIPAKPRR